MRLRLAAAALGVVTAVAVAGCGNGTPADLGFTPAPTTHAPQQNPAKQLSQLRKSLTKAVKRFSAADLSGDLKTVKSMTSHRCIVALGPKQLRTRVATAASTHGKLKPGSIKITSISTGSAVVTATYLLPAATNLTLHWTYDHGWREDDC